MQLLVKPIRALLFIFLLFGGLYFAKPVLVPIAISGLLSMLFFPLSQRLEKRGIGRSIAAILCVLCLMLVGSIIVLLVLWRSSDLIRDMAGIGDRVHVLMGELKQFINHTFGIKPAQQQQMLEQQSSGAGGLIASLVDSLLDVAIDTVLVFVYMFLLIYFRGHLKRFILKLVPSSKQNETGQIINQSSKVAQLYLTGLAMMIATLWVLYGIGFSIIGVKQAIFLAILCGLLEMIPFVGNLTGSLITILVSVAQGADSQMVLSIILVYGLVQFTQTYFLEPLIVGAEVCINPLFTILVIVVGEAVWGIPGMVLALPVLGIVKIVCDHVEPLKPYGFLIGRVGSKKETNPLSTLKGFFAKKR